MNHNFRELKVWQNGIELSKSIYQMTSTFPTEEKFGLKSQIQRCAVSIPSNIAEGCGRTGNNELKHFLTISLGSAFELETQVILANEFGYTDKNNFEITLQILSTLYEALPKFTNKKNLLSPWLKQETIKQH
jgi:four helix bundle protein